MVDIPSEMPPLTRVRQSSAAIGKIVKNRERADGYRIRFKSFEHLQLDATVREVIATVKRTGGIVKGPVPLPTRIERFTVNRSPHVDKHSREQFEMKTHQRMIDILEPSDRTRHALMRLDLPAIIEVTMKETCDQKVPRGSGQVDRGNDARW